MSDPVTEKPSEPVPYEVRERIRAFVKKHGGSFHGPNIEHLSMEEQAFYRMMVDYAASPSPPAGMSAPWQDISTAPKDGTRVLLFYPSVYEDDQQAVGWYERDLRDGPRWMDHADAKDYEQPTHWMPRPAPPALTEKQP